MSTPADQIVFLQTLQAQNDAGIAGMNDQIVSNNNTIDQMHSQIATANATIVDYQNQNSMIDDIIAEITPPPSGNVC